jgi:hypothetical protein
MTLGELSTLFNKYKKPKYILMLNPLTKFEILVSLVEEIKLNSGKTKSLTVNKVFCADLYMVMKMPIEQGVEQFLSEMEEKLNLAKYHARMEEYSEVVRRMYGVTPEMLCRERGML